MTVQYIGSIENEEVMRVGLGETCLVPSNSPEVLSWIANGNEITPIVPPTVMDEGEPFVPTFNPLA